MGTVKRLPMKSELRPSQKLRVYDLVAAAGLDVADWSNSRRGRKYAAMNPKYCYEWAFVKPKKVVVLNLWYDSMRERNGVIEQTQNLRESARISQKLRRKGVWAARALRMDLAIQEAAKHKLPVRVIVCDGVMRDRDDPEASASRVTARLLDPIPWAVTAYNWRTGQCTLTRGASEDRFVDQFSIQTETPDRPARHSVSIEAFDRDPGVRKRALIRADGKCELCRQRGFTMKDGRVFLETHHVISLADGGPDIDGNVASLCPNHHREAHYGKGGKRIQMQLLARLRRN